jgi:hypothetical protein
VENATTPIDRNIILARFIDTGNPRKDVRLFIRKCVDPDRLYSLDEIAGVSSTVASVSLAFLALTLSEFRLMFGVLTAVTSLFFWIGYRVGKIKHAIDIRFAVILSFIMFMYISIVFVIIGVITAPFGSVLFIFSATFAAAIVILIMYISLKPVAKAQNSLCKWLLHNEFTLILENDEELEQVMTNSFRGLVDASEANAYLAGFLTFFFYFPIPWTTISITLVCYLIALVVVLRLLLLRRNISS